MNTQKIFLSARIIIIRAISIMILFSTACSRDSNLRLSETVAPVLEKESSTPVPSPDTAESGSPKRFVDDHGVPMALVPAGPFEMGSYDGAEDEQPVHTVILNDFYIDQYEVTNSQYATCVNEGVCDPTTDTTAFESSYSRGIYYGNPEYADYPVIYANWYEAQKYCEWRGARLPTEAEWEKAARGDLDGKNYPWGNESPVCEFGAMNGAKFDDDGNCNNTDTEEVGSYSANGYGLYDMAGNVWEWVSDFYDENYYANSPTENPSGPEEGSYPVIRGGSWNNHVDRLRVSDRRFNDPKSGSLSSGFRCARDVIP
jgi:formylglycine-generating enzyme required for sulfatase activity